MPKGQAASRCQRWTRNLLGAHPSEDTPPSAVAGAQGPWTGRTSLTGSRRAEREVWLRAEQGRRCGPSGAGRDCEEETALSQQLRVRQQVSSQAMSDLHPAVPAKDWQDSQDWALPREKLILPEAAPRPTRRTSPGPEGEKPLSKRKAAPGWRKAAASWPALWHLDFF